MSAALADVVPSGTLVFYSDFDDFQTWKGALLAQLPRLRVLHASELTDRASVHFALVWKHVAAGRVDVTDLVEAETGSPMGFVERNRLQHSRAK